MGPITHIIQMGLDRRIACVRQGNSNKMNNTHPCQLHLRKHHKTGDIHIQWFTIQLGVYSLSVNTLSIVHWPYHSKEGFMYIYPDIYRPFGSSGDHLELMISAVSGVGTFTLCSSGGQPFCHRGQKKTCDFCIGLHPQLYQRAHYNFCLWWPIRRH